MEFRNFYDNLHLAPSSADRYRLVHQIELLITQLLNDFVTKGNAEIPIVYNNSRRIVSYGRQRSRLHFAQLIYVLGEVHQLLIAGGSCTLRELYYKERQITQRQTNVNRAIRHICGILQTTPWNLGILSSGKGLVAGNLRMHLMNGGIVDCRFSNGPVLLPQDFSCVNHLETTATFALIVEKDTVFSKLVSCNILQRCLGVGIGDGILITGKGYPDLSTRALVHRLAAECTLPMYILVDADPYGVDIMLVYRYGSSMLPHANDEQFSCPQIHWIGVHPTEIALMTGISTMPLTDGDVRKARRLLQRRRLDVGVRNELQILLALRRKAEIEGMSGNDLNFFISDYIPNKIKRNLLI